MNISIPIPFSESKLHFGTVWANLTSTDNDTGLSSARVGALAVRVADGDTVKGASAFALGKAMPTPVDPIDAAATAADDDELILAKHKIERLEKEVSARDNQLQTIKAGIKERVPADYQPTTGTKPQPKAATDPVTEDAPPAASNDFAGLSEAQLMSMSFD